MNGDGHGTPVDFVLLGHPANYEHMCDLFLHFRPDYNRDKLRNYKATVAKLFEWTPTYATKTPLTIALGSEQELSGRLIICTFLPEMIRSPRQMVNAFQKTLAGCRLGKDLGAKIVGLGGFTSIVSGSQGENLAKQVDIAVTSGNSLGATGDIGRACVLALAPRAHRTLLVARNEAKLCALRDELPAGLQSDVSTDVHVARRASVVIAATSASQPILAEADLKPGTLVCDIGYPKNLSCAPEPRPDLLVISGGLATMPFELGITYYTGLPSPTLIYGCFAEAMILVMDGRYESYSVGQGRITPEKMETILARALARGFRPAPPYRGGKRISEEALALFAQRYHSPGEVRP